MRSVVTEVVWKMKQDIVNDIRNEVMEGLREEIIKEISEEIKVILFHYRTIIGHQSHMFLSIRTQSTSKCFI